MIELLLQDSNISVVNFGNSKIIVFNFPGSFYEITLDSKDTNNGLPMEYFEGLWYGLGV